MIAVDTFSVIHDFPHHAVVHENDPVTEVEDLRELRGKDDDPFPLDGQTSDDVVNLVLRTHVHAAGGLVHEEDVSFTIEALRYDDLLLVSTAQESHLLVPVTGGHG